MSYFARVRDVFVHFDVIHLFRRCVNQLFCRKSSDFFFIVHVTDRGLPKKLNDVDIPTSGLSEQLSLVNMIFIIF